MLCETNSQPESYLSRQEEGSSREQDILNFFLIFLKLFCEHNKLLLKKNKICKL